MPPTTTETRYFSKRTVENETAKKNFIRQALTDGFTVLTRADGDGTLLATNGDGSDLPAGEWKPCFGDPLTDVGKQAVADWLKANPQKTA